VTCAELGAHRLLSLGGAPVASASLCTHPRGALLCINAVAAAEAASVAHVLELEGFASDGRPRLRARLVGVMERGCTRTATMLLVEPPAAADSGSATANAAAYHGFSRCAAVSAALAAELFGPAVAVGRAAIALRGLEDGVVEWARADDAVAGTFEPLLALGEPVAELWALPPHSAVVAVGAAGRVRVASLPATAAPHIERVLRCREHSLRVSLAPAQAAPCVGGAALWFASAGRVFFAPLDAGVVSARAFPTGFADAAVAVAVAGDAAADGGGVALAVSASGEMCVLPDALHAAAALGTPLLHWADALSAGAAPPQLLKGYLSLMAETAKLVEEGTAAEAQLDALFGAAATALGALRCGDAAGLHADLALHSVPALGFSRPPSILASASPLPQLSAVRLSATVTLRNSGTESALFPARCAWLLLTLKHSATGVVPLVCTVCAPVPVPELRRGESVRVPLSLPEPLDPLAALSATLSLVVAAPAFRQQHGQPHRVSLSAIFARRRATLVATLASGKIDLLSMLHAASHSPQAEPRLAPLLVEPEGAAPWWTSALRALFVAEGAPPEPVAATLAAPAAALDRLVLHVAVPLTPGMDAAVATSTVHRALTSALGHVEARESGGSGGGATAVASLLACGALPVVSVHCAAGDTLRLGESSVATLVRVAVATSIGGFSALLSVRHCVLERLARFARRRGTVSAFALLLSRPGVASLPLVERKLPALVTRARPLFEQLVREAQSEGATLEASTRAAALNRELWQELATVLIA
jgi:hypothetical protein